jgi:ribonuclease-3
MSAALTQLQARLAYTFRDPARLERAVTHPSWLQDHPGAGESNQRLEFLGDAVLQLVLTEALFQLYPADREGVLSQRRASLTKGAFLAMLAREVGLESCLRLGGSEEAGGGRTRASALEDALEAVIGALYLDSDLPTVRRVVLDLYGSLPARLAVESSDNPKGRLQELVQPRHGNDALRYEVTHVEGADHAREYEVAVFLLSHRLGSGRGTSKKLAEEAAALAALEALKAES